MTKKIKLLLGIFSITAISIIAISSIVSCSSNDNNKNSVQSSTDNKNTNKTSTSSSDSNKNASDTNNSNPDKSSTKSPTSSGSDSNNNTSTPKINKNGAISTSNNQGIQNGNLTDAKVAWKDSSNTGTISITNDSFLVLDTTNIDETNNDVYYDWYITNESSNFLIANSKLMNTTTTSSTQLSKQFQNDPNNFTYYVFAIISSPSAKYKLQTPAVVLNFVNNANPSLVIQNANSNGSVCVNSSVTIGLDPNYVNANNTAYTYKWYAINAYNKTLLKTLSNAKDSSLNFYVNESMYYAVQCEIYDGSKLLATSNIFNFFVSPWAVVTLTNPAIINSSLTINNNQEILTASISNANWSTTDESNLVYSWYEQKNATGDNVNLWTSLPNNSSSLTISSVNAYANYYTNYKVVVKSKSNPNIFVTSNMITVYSNQTIGSPIITATNASNNLLQVDNNQKVDLSLDLTKMNVPSSYLTYQWQEEINGTWTNLNVTTSTYSMIETNSSTHYYRVLIGLNNNFDAISVYTPTFTVEIKPISQQLHNEILNKVNTYLDLNSTYSGLNSLLYSYFTNSNSPGYDWLYNQFIGVNENSPFQDDTNSNTYANFSSSNTIDIALTLSNIASYFKLQSISMPSDATNPQFNFITLKTFYFCYLNQNNENTFVEIPSGTTFVWNTPFYYTTFNYGYWYNNGSDFKSGSITNEINIDVLASGAVNINLVMNILNVSYSQILTYNLEASLYPANQNDFTPINPWGIEFNNSTINNSLSDYLSNLTGSSGNYIPFNTISEFSSNNTFVLNASTVPNFPNFLSEISKQATSVIAVFDKKAAW